MTVQLKLTDCNYFPCELNTMDLFELLLYQMGLHSKDMGAKYKDDHWEITVGGTVFHFGFDGMAQGYSYVLDGFVKYVPSNGEQKVFEVVNAGKEGEGR